MVATRSAALRTPTLQERERERENPKRLDSLFHTSPSVPDPAVVGYTDFGEDAPFLGVGLPDGRNGRLRGASPPDLPVEGAELDSFADMFGGNVFGAGQVGDGPADCEDAVVGTGGDEGL